MTDLVWAEAPSRAELVSRIHGELRSVGASLRTIARDVLAADARIDLVAADPDGRVTLVLVGTEPDDLGLVTLALAQRAWVEARLPDWVQLAPQLGLLAEGPVRVVLVAPDFSATAKAAVRATGGDEFDLIRFRCVQGGGNGSPGPVKILLEAADLAGSPQGDSISANPQGTSRFRTGLSDADLMVSSEERRGLGPAPRGKSENDENRRLG